MLSNKTLNNLVYDNFFLEQTFNSPTMLLHSKKEIEWLTSFLNLSKTSRILDVACGSGRHLKAFVDLGYSHFGLDTSPACIKLAKENCPSVTNQITEIDFLSFSQNNSEKFDLVFIAGASFGYDPSLAVNLEYLKNLMQLVSASGYLVIQFLNKSWAKAFVKNKLTFWQENENYYTLDKRTLKGDLLISDKIFIKKIVHFKRIIAILFTCLLKVNF